MKEKNKVEIKEFFGTNVRVVNEDWIVMKDMFGALGRLDSKGDVPSATSNKVDEKIGLLKLCPRKSFTVPVKVSKSKGGNKNEFVDISCVNLKDSPVLLTFFEPTARAGEVALKTWVEFMKFVNNLLVANNVNLFDIQDRRNQMSAQDKLDSDGGKVMIMNTMISKMLAELIGVEGKILKGDIRKFQDENPQIRLDLGLVYEELREDFVSAYSFTQSHSTSKDMALNKAKRKYKI
ncbi:MAG: hypothetical protein ACRDDY_03900 [Clostridium sp.]|uniref:hypothetical protein n=1 Tax=Clostridium sp. TaxID=1506 RepID=UPI003EE4F676